MNIVIIEDDESIRENLQEILEVYHYTVSAYPDGAQGLKGIYENIPDLIICDIMTPNMNGYEVLDALKLKESTANVPFIFLTAKTEAADQRRGMAMGADDYIFKPFTANDLLNAINIRLKKQKYNESKIQTELYKKLQAFAKINSHEYNTPLNGILGLAEILKESAAQLSPIEIVDIARSIKTSADRLHHTFQNFIRYILLQKGKVNDELTTVNKDWFDQLIQSELSEKAIKFNRMGETRFESLIQPGYCTSIPQQDLSYIVQELIWNAFKFSKNITEVRAKVEVKQQLFSICISNTTDDLDFFKNAEPFKQSNRELKEQQGSGLGVYLCKKIAELHGWRINESNNSGVTTICLEISVQPTYLL